MNMFAKIALAAALGALAISGAAQAQETPSNAQVGNVDGQAMASHQGSEYTQLSSGETVGSGDAIMVSPNSSVVLNVTDGTRTWQVTLPPGTYRITPGLLRTASGQTVASLSHGNLAMSVGIIVGTALVGAAAIDNMDEVPPVHPVSQ